MYSENGESESCSKSWSCCGLVDKSSFCPLQVNRVQISIMALVSFGKTFAILDLLEAPVKYHRYHGNLTKLPSNHGNLMVLAWYFHGFNGNFIMISCTQKS